MGTNQQTIKAPISVSGHGLHTGAPVTMTFKPAPENHGFVFKRVDLEGQPEIPADVDLVVDTSRGTTIGLRGVKVHTVEHTLAALVGLQIDNALIELDGPEPPITDGSAKIFTEKLLEAGIEEQSAEREYFVIDEPIHYLETERSVELAALPSDAYHATVMVDYGSSILKAQHAKMNSLDDFSDEIADSRTFCFLHELVAMHNAGLVKGGTIESAVVVIENEVSDQEKAALEELFGPLERELKPGILNDTGLRHENEAARHKLLDLVGDLALVGMPLKGHIMASRPGHKANVELAKRIKAKIKQKRITRKFQKKEKKGLVFDINAIQEILPHRYPFLLIDKIVNFSENSITGVKNVTINEPFFQGHFPGNPIMPGVLQLEAMAQVGGILLLNTIDNPKSVWVYFVAIDNARFKKPVIPGDTVVLELEMTALKRSICKMTGKAYVDGQLVCSADLVASVVPKNKL
ncbi:bifunctional UDP-3-O-[3-hydroxymyristoyl] N-acetylglucosamine deacetylase/3-hydroxyacyl-ACP dehydratase [Pontibacter sp. G13]|uniref:bifunctional UDP-3-O-[3-hydroxymyristoyl] N-acetylglucosamine deacetylase/3-hydroxyacyl-ACP dehydratase n=1 Tax=Pontibacter sp. G13 TaxID=3074898 RepID=UPI00288B277B|nr:bifunctional UDP-3-O-[3-hydroxymyristoyl] N-acetylglucosamine deacetylase/3-hydroxyacyl-ACP dehydratase [Pontibacter sp. G13]WNJ18840.1 bifunctional UDP-3-O-[3-hydroxymyristoyl] N-acetylglucosamine deacetylase/3-hydroxyacyl-ACP dehydratase [Pontibacter sp. G13]